MTNYRFSDGDEEILRRILHKVGLWADIEQRLAPPIGRSTGAGRKSRVYFVFIPTGDGTRGRYLVAKFDEEGRQRQEWAALQELTQIDTPLEMLLPIAGNEPGDGAIVFQAAQGVMGHLACMDLLDVLRRQIEHNPGTAYVPLSSRRKFWGVFMTASPDQRTSPSIAKSSPGQMSSSLRAERAGSTSKVRFRQQVTAGLMWTGV